MKSRAIAFVTALSCHFGGEAPASVMLITQGERVVVTTRFTGTESWRALEKGESQAGLVIAKDERAPAILTMPLSLDTEAQATVTKAKEDRAREAAQSRKAVQARASKEGGSKAAVICNRGLMQMQAGQVDEAIKAFESAMQLNPKYDRALMLRGVAAARKGNHWEAIEYYNRALVLDSDSVQSYQSRGLSFIQLKLFNKALADFSTVIRLNPEFEEGYVKRGLVHGRMGKFELSIEDNTKAIALNPNNPLSYNNRAAAYKALGQMDLAEADFRKSQELERRKKDK